MRQKRDIRSSSNFLDTGIIRETFDELIQAMIESNAVKL